MYQNSPFAFEIWAEMSRKDSRGGQKDTFFGQKRSFSGTKRPKCEFLTKKTENRLSPLPSEHGKPQNPQG